MKTLRMDDATYGWMKTTIMDMKSMYADDLARAVAEKVDELMGNRLTLEEKREIAKRYYQEASLNGNPAAAAAWLSGVRYGLGMSDGEWDALRDELADMLDAYIECGLED